jgi:hypothetical protein
LEGELELKTICGAVDAELTPEGVQMAKAFARHSVLLDPLMAALPSLREKGRLIAASPYQSPLLG